MKPSRRRIRPTPTTRYLGNPHKGCCTFQHFNGDPLFPDNQWLESGPTSFPDRVTPGVIPGYLPSTVAYCRWFWKTIEPEPGRYDFTVIEKSLELCAQRGQTLAVRLMPFGSAKAQPALPDWYMERHETHRWIIPWSGKEIRIPDHNSEVYLQKWGDVHRAFGERFDGHPLLESYDVAYAGPWGEGAGQCASRQHERFATIYAQALPQTPLLSLFTLEQLRVGVRSGFGWRIDCFGDASAGCAPADTHTPLPLSYDHMFDVYPKHLALADGQDVWRRRPVFFETCHHPMGWFETERDLEFILQQGLKYHGSYFMPKQTYLPDPWLDDLKDFCRQLGYRFVYRQATVSKRVRPGSSFHFDTWIENVGVAPIYREYAFALRFRQNSQEIVHILDDVDIRGWLPGDAWIEQRVRLPEAIKPGVVQLAAGLVRRDTKQPRVRFAVEEQFPEGWVDLGGIEVLGTRRTPRTRND